MRSGSSSVSSVDAVADGAQGAHDAGAAVVAVVAERLAGPLAGDEDAAAGVAEGVGAVGLAPAAAGRARRARPWAGRRSGASSRTAPSTAPAQFLGEPAPRARAGGRWRVGGIRRRPWSGTWPGSRCSRPRVLVPASTPWASTRGPNRTTCAGGCVRVVVDRVQRLLPGGQRLAGLRVDVAAGAVVPDGRRSRGVDDRVVRRPPDLVVGRGDDLPEQGAGHGAADGHVQVRGEPALGFDGGEVLHVQPAGRRRFCQNRSTSSPKCSASRAARGSRSCAGPPVPRRARPAVGGHGQGDEQRRAERLAVRGVEGAPERGRRHRHLREVGCVLAAAGGSDAAG